MKLCLFDGLVISSLQNHIVPSFRSFFTSFINFLRFSSFLFFSHSLLIEISPSQLSQASTIQSAFNTSKAFSNIRLKESQLSNTKATPSKNSSILHTFSTSFAPLPNPTPHLSAPQPQTNQSSIRIMVRSYERQIKSSQRCGYVADESVPELERPIRTTQYGKIRGIFVHTEPWSIGVKSNFLNFSNVECKFK